MYAFVAVLNVDSNSLLISQSGVCAYLLVLLVLYLSAVSNYLIIHLHFSRFSYTEKLKSLPKL